MYAGVLSNPYDGERRPGTVGLPLPRFELRLAEDTDEVLLGGPNGMSGRVRRTARNALGKVVKAQLT